MGKSDSTNVKLGFYEPIKREDTKTIKLFLLYYVTKNDHGDTFFAEAAQTRLQNIKNSSWFDIEIHKVHCIPIQDIAEIIEITQRYIDIYEGEDIAFTKEVGIFSHSGLDGPIGSVKCSVDPEPIWESQMMLIGWSQINFNWISNELRTFVAYGCNSANERNLSKIFAQNLSNLGNFNDVEGWGQSTSSFPSALPDIRCTSIARSVGDGLPFAFDVGYTYMVGGNKGEGAAAQATNPFSEFPKANPMNCYKNGNKIYSTHQGYFNDHRKNK